LVHPKKKTIGLRVPEHAVARELLEAMGEPLLTTTLRAADAAEGEGPMWDTDDIVHRLGKQVSLILDAGQGQQEMSTVVDFTEDEPYIVRQGIGELR
jgi:tRNA threonylcarbamoyl adenosine modification protein (Sua5/YciO/YrdC/YwlC family)